MEKVSPSVAPAARGPSAGIGEGKPSPAGLSLLVPSVPPALNVHSVGSLGEEWAAARSPVTFAMKSRQLWHFSAK